MKTVQITLIMHLAATILGSTTGSTPAKSTGTTTAATAEPEFSYLLGGNDWSTAFPTCGGQNQSPVDIVTNNVAAGALTGTDLEMRLRTNIAYVIDQFTAHNVNTAGQFSILTLLDTVKGKGVFNSSGFHVHAPSEHTINGVRGDAEVHIVHKLSPDQVGVYPFSVAVFGIIFKKTAGNPSTFFTNWGINSKQNTVQFNMTAAFQKEILSVGNFYRYTGSFTTPPCTEGVEFFLLDTMLDISDSQLKIIQDLFQNNQAFAGGKGNNRNTQALNGRVIRKFAFDTLHNYGQGIIVNAATILNVFVVSFMAVRMLMK